MLIEEEDDGTIVLLNICVYVKIQQNQDQEYDSFL